MSFRFRRNPSVEAAPLQQDLMLFNASAKRFCVLNASAAHVWEQLAEPRTPEELAVSLRGEFAATEQASVEDDVRTVLDQLESLDLVSRES